MNEKSKDYCKTNLKQHVLFFITYFGWPYQPSSGLQMLRKFIPPPWYREGWMDPLRVLDCSISKRFYLQWNVFDLLYKMRYILWVVALLGACDVTNNGRHLGFY